MSKGLSGRAQDKSVAGTCTCIYTCVVLVYTCVNVKLCVSYDLQGKYSSLQESLIIISLSAAVTSKVAEKQCHVIEPLISTCICLCACICTFQFQVFLLVASSRVEVPVSCSLHLFNVWLAASFFLSAETTYTSYQGTTWQH